MKDKYHVVKDIKSSALCNIFITSSKTILKPKTEWIDWSMGIYLLNKIKTHDKNIAWFNYRFQQQLICK